MLLRKERKSFCCQRSTSLPAMSLATHHQPTASCSQVRVSPPGCSPPVAAADDAAAFRPCCAPPPPSGRGAKGDSTFPDSLISGSTLSAWEQRGMLLGVCAVHQHTVPQSDRKSSDPTNLGVEPPTVEALKMEVNAEESVMLLVVPVHVHQHLQ